MAVDLLAPVTAELALLQPSRRTGVWPAKRGQMHLTLHFIGKAGIGRMADSLKAVKVPARSNPWRTFLPLRKNS